MKKILQITNYMYPHIGGIEQVSRDILDCTKDIYEERILCFNHEKGNCIDEVDGVTVTRVNCQVKISSQQIALSFGKYLKNELKIFNPDIVIFHYPNPFEAFYLTRYLKNKKFIFILYWHLDITKQKILGKLFSSQNKKLLKYADRIVATSPNYIDGSRWLSTYKDKCRIIPCCVNSKRLEYNENHLNIAEIIRKKYYSKKICFAFGRHVEYKGIEFLIKASKLLDDSFIVLIGGTGPLTDKLKKLASNMNNVVFLGRIDDDNLKGYLLACDVFCFPSITKNEAFGIGLAEAMFYSKPCVTFTIPGSGVNYVSLNNVTGIEVENRNFEAYAEAIKKISSDQSLMDFFGKNAKKRIDNLFLQKKFDLSIKALLDEFEKKNCKELED